MINICRHQTRAAVLEEERLAEFYMETGESQEKMGNIYLGRVVDVLPSMQAAFIDIGQEKNAFLYIDDALPHNWQEGKRDKPKPNIRELVHSGQQLLVQVNKEATGTKAPRVTTQLGIPGRTIVYMPNSDQQVSVSRKIKSERERQRLQQTTAALLQASEGAIVRTLAEGLDAEQIAHEWMYLRAAWQEALEKSRNNKIPALVYQDTDLLNRIIRDLFADDVSELWIDQHEAYKQAKKMVAALYPHLQNRVRFYQGRQSLFDHYQVEAEIDKALRRQVWLKSGGYLIIDFTEAMTVIDVNTGKYTGKSAQQLEETVTKTNLEAAKEIARQLRLRDIGGIIIIDFIDMKQPSNRERVLQTLQAEMEKDRTTSYVVGMTQLGLVEMTRKKSRQSIGEALTRLCPTCEGKGRVLQQAEVIQRLWRELSGYAKQAEAEAVVAYLPIEVYRELEPADKAAWERQLGFELFIGSKENLHPSQYEIAYLGAKAEAVRLFENQLV
nr:Rne/Rng family ribonuclease [Brevibacillus fulvus]